jgi:hypothetical protein
MVIRFPFRRKPAPLPLFTEDDRRLQSHPSGLNRTDRRRLSAREVEHRERMLRHLARLDRAAQ